MSSNRNHRKKQQRLRKKTEKEAFVSERESVQDALSMLSEETRRALEEHLREREGGNKSVNKDVGGVDENFHLSQFWYDDDSSDLLALEALETADAIRGQGKGTGRIACISCPSIYRAIQRKLESEGDEAKNDVVLFEFDQRLSRLVPETQAHRNFVLYDFREEDLSRMIPAEFEGYFDFVVADPPYLNQDCMLAFQKAVEYVSVRRDDIGQSAAWLFCTGAVLEPVFAERLPEYKRCEFQPRHASKLGNSFATYATYDSHRLK